MMILMVVFLFCLAAELVVTLIPITMFRRVVSLLLLVAVVMLAGFIVLVNCNLASIVLGVLSAYRVANLARVVQIHMQVERLRNATRQASIGLASLQLLVLGVWWLAVHGLDLLSIGAWGMAVAGLVFFTSTIRSLVKTRPDRTQLAELSASDLPTLTVAIPARNETRDLEECLLSLVASTYPKLEVLVLDDCSQNKRTPEIIRSFAHAGVRFLEGEATRDGWIAKNQAYQQLIEAASGDLVLFCGVDVRFAPQTLTKLVGILLHKKKSMISAIPANTGLLSPLQVMRYAWELALPRRFFRQPPTLSTCWIAKRELLRSAGGFAAVRQAIIPERYFARQAAQEDMYSFVQSTSETGLLSVKSRADQRATAQRVWYPRLRRHIASVAVVSLVELGLVAGPYGLLIVGTLGHLAPQVTLLTGFAALLNSLTCLLIVHSAYRRWHITSLLLPPFASLIDVLTLNDSMLRYEFDEVIWKDRNVCIPMMQMPQA